MSGCRLWFALVSAAPTIGFDVSAARIRELRDGYDRTGEVSAEELATSDITFTSQYRRAGDGGIFTSSLSPPR